MKVKVRLFATLREGREKEAVLDLEEGAPAQMVIDFLDIPEKEVSIFLVNGRDGARSQILREGDTVSIFPPVGGG